MSRFSVSRVQQAMSWSSIFVDTPLAIYAYCSAVISKAFLSPGGAYGLTSLLAATLISAGFLLWRRSGRRRPIRFKVLRRALFPHRIMSHPSTAADIQYLMFNVFLFGLLFGWAIMSGQFIANGVRGGLVGVFGELSPSSLPLWLQMAAMTLALFLAYELAYWLDHYLAHSLPFLWEFHKVHHSAEVLSPLTNARVHPVDTIVFYNMTALVMGVVGGLMQFGLGKPVPDFSFWNNNAIAFVFAYLINHLQHSHMWIAFTGIWGKLLLSPAHHQIHHSTNPIHFNTNMGSSLAIFDWMFGTLHIPQKKREKLTFGVEPWVGNPHSLPESLTTPIKSAFGHALPAPDQPAPLDGPKATA